MDINNAEDHIFGLVLMNDWSGTFPIQYFLVTMPCPIIGALMNYIWQLEIFRHGNIFLLVLFLERVLVRCYK